MIFPNQTALVVLPEASEPSACVNWEPGIFPTETPIPANKQSPPIDNKITARWDDPLVIERGEHYVVFWDLEPASKRNPRTYSGKCELPPVWYGALGFVPGDYAFTIEGNAYALQAPTSPTPPVAFQAVQPSTTGATPQAENHASPSSASRELQLSDLRNRSISGGVPTHHFSETKTLHVGLSQITTLLAAMLGAFIAYWVTALKPGQDWDAFMLVLNPNASIPAGGNPAAPSSASRKWFALLSLARNSVLASILGGVVTIVASRLSDTHFPVKVSVSDWWGALTIGFVAFFIGNKFIDSLSTLGSSSAGSNLGKPPGAPAPAAPAVLAPAAPGAAAPVIAPAAAVR